MATTTRTPSERTVDFLIQRGSDDWGDEAERLRYYEAHSAMLQLGYIVQPLVAAGFMLALGRPALVPCLALWAVPTVMGWFGTRYLQRKGVRAYQLAERTLVRTVLLFVVPNLLPVAAWAWVQRDSSSGVASVLGVLTGALVGVGIGAFVIRAKAKTELTGP